MSPPYKQFIKDTRNGKKQKKCDHLESFFNFISFEADFNTFRIKLLEENQANVDLRTGASVAQHEFNPILHKEQQTTESLLNNKKNLPEWKKVPIISSDLDINNVPKTTVLAMKLNEKRGINKGAYTDERLTIVKDKTSVQLFIVALTGRNRDVLTCKCKTFLWYNFCNHSVSVACELNIWLVYFVVVRKSIETMPEKVLSAAIESDLSAKEKSIKKDEIRKNATTETKKTSNQA